MYIELKHYNIYNCITVPTRYLYTYFIVEEKLIFLSCKICSIFSSQEKLWNYILRMIEIQNYKSYIKKKKMCSILIWRIINKSIYLKKSKNIPKYSSYSTKIKIISKYVKSNLIFIFIIATNKKIFLVYQH